MQKFVNREEELRIVAERCDALLEKNRPIQAQFIEFHGLGGMGKTTLLKEVEFRCNERDLYSIWADASQTADHFSHEIVDQVQKKYGIQFTPASSDLINQSINATKALLKEGPAVFLVDSLDAASEEQLNWIEHVLLNFAEDSRLFFVLASKRSILFEHAMSVSRRLTPVQLKPFDRANCTFYVRDLAENIEPEVQDLVFEWTGGYPLAVNVMVQAIRNEKLDPRGEKDRMQILSMIAEHVIKQGILADTVQPPDNFHWYQTMLSLFSVPRRCNIPMMQRMIETFAPEYRLSGSLAYLGLPKIINQAADVFSWNPSKAGFSLDASIRHVFLNKLKIEQHERYVAIHRFLAEVNRREALKYTGTDRSRALQEYLYHSACSEEDAAIQHIVEKTVQQLIAGSATDPRLSVENFSSFHEEYMRDNELMAALGANSDTVVSLMYKRLATINRQLIAGATSPQERVFYLREFFDYSILDPAVNDVRLLSQQIIQQIVREESVDIRRRLYELLSRDAEIKERLDAHADDILSLLISAQDSVSS
jgi:NB-ARC domain